MYTSHFGLTESPLMITPDPRYLFMGGCHREVMAHLLYGIREHGVLVLPIIVNGAQSERYKGKNVWHVYSTWRYCCQGVVGPWKICNGPSWPGA